MNRRSYLRAVAFVFSAPLLCVFILWIFGTRETALFVSSTSGAPAVAEKLSLPGVPNAGKVSDSLYRGAQPRETGYKELQNLGISIVVDLRTGLSERRAERSAVESLGMRHISIPTSGFFGPGDDQVAEFLKLLRDNPAKKIFVHCYFGDDRTGVMVAVYRIAEQHWTPGQAYSKMCLFHFHRYLLFMSRYVKYFDASFAVNPAFESLRPASTPNEDTRGPH
jgi:tyrosine-protein phosphatase SIW14